MCTRVGYVLKKLFNNWQRSVQSGKRDLRKKPRRAAPGARLNYLHSETNKEMIVVRFITNNRTGFCATINRIHTSFLRYVDGH